jgi:CRISPR-associated protein Cmr6
MSEKLILAEIPVPASLRDLLNRLASDRQRHPGLMLDRFLQPCPQQEQQRDVLAVVAGLEGNQGLLAEQQTRRAEGLNALAARTWSRTTQGRLTLHLARASALENAGLCLHPIYGFAYLPGTGLKGMTRSYAETVWLPAQPDPIGAWQTIERVFGWAPGSDEIDRKPKPWKPASVPPHGKKDRAASGLVVFHDAWPEQWPGLLVDIVNNHHPKYYQGEDAAGEWDSPVPVYFLAVKPGTTFSVALSKRRTDVPDQLLNLASEWLDGALTVLGCGAKTAAGYGAFAPRQGGAPVTAPRLAEATFTLELLTPAYLAGASPQQREDCDLRSATLRGLLRWWWRTMHAGFVDRPTLRSMEAAVWGSTEAGGAVQVRVTRLSGEVGPSPYKTLNGDRLEFNDAFHRQHNLIRGPRNITQGLAYAGYGMDEMVTEGGPRRRRARWCAQPGSRWRVDVVARPGKFRLKDGRGKTVHEAPLDAALLLDQAKTALWWFGKLGGAGSKSRKGFGSFAMPAQMQGFEGERWITQGRRLRTACGLPETDFDVNLVESPSLKLMRNLSRAVVGETTDWLVVSTPWNDPWRVLDLIGWAMQSCAQSDPDTGHGKHCPAKRGLGLPRKIHGPRKEPMRHQKSHQPPEDLSSERGDRHSSPVLFHVARGARGNLEVQVAGFPTADLREPGMPHAAGLQDHEVFLAEYLRHLSDEFEGWLADRGRR